jgi:hypothetical protein
MQSQIKGAFQVPRQAKLQGTWGSPSVPDQCPNCGHVIPKGSTKLSASVPNWVWFPFVDLFPEGTGVSEMLQTAIQTHLLESKP